jgi:hypothetical protein
LFIFTEWTGRTGQYGIQNLGIRWKRPYRYTIYYLIIFLILYFGNFNKNQFIYFQF